MNKPPIRVKEFWPAVPFKDSEWIRAWRDGDEESGRRGYGRTIQEAIEDLKAQEDDDEPHTV